MSMWSVFADSFLDGFTMAGFLNRLRQPGEATQMFAASTADPEAEWQPLTFEPASAAPGGVEVDGDLRGIPEQALHAMIDLLKREDEARRKSHTMPDKAEYGASR